MSTDDVVGGFALKRVLVSLLLAGLGGHAQAGSRDQAKRLHDRLAGVPPSAQTLEQMATLIENGQAAEAANIPEHHIHSEYFAPPVTPETTNHPFTLHLKDGREISVSEDNVNQLLLQPKCWKVCKRILVLHVLK